MRWSYQGIMEWFQARVSSDVLPITEQNITGSEAAFFNAIDYYGYNHSCAIARTFFENSSYTEFGGHSFLDSESCEFLRQWGEGDELYEPACNTTRIVEELAQINGNITITPTLQTLHGYYQIDTDCEIYTTFSKTPGSTYCNDIFTPLFHGKWNDYCSRVPVFNVPLFWKLSLAGSFLHMASIIALKCIEKRRPEQGTSLFFILGQIGYKLSEYSSLMMRTFYIIHNVYYDQLIPLDMESIHRNRYLIYSAVAVFSFVGLLLNLSTMLRKNISQKRTLQLVFAQNVHATLSSYIKNVSELFSVIYTFFSPSDAREEAETAMAYFLALTIAPIGAFEIAVERFSEIHNFLSKCGGFGRIILVAVNVMYSFSLNTAIHEFFDFIDYDLDLSRGLVGLSEGCKTVLSVVISTLLTCYILSLRFVLDGDPPTKVTLSVIEVILSSTTLYSALLCSLYAKDLHSTDVLLNFQEIGDPHSYIIMAFPFIYHRIIDRLISVSSNNFIAREKGTSSVGKMEFMYRWINSYMGGGVIDYMLPTCFCTSKRLVSPDLNSPKVQKNGIFLYLTQHLCFCCCQDS